MIARRVVLALASALACAAVARAALGPRYGGTLRIAATDAAVDTQLAGAVRGAGPLLVAGLVHETLVDIAPDGTVRPALARGWGSAAEGREWTLRLAGGAVFHDGRPVTAADVVRSLRRFLRSDSPAGARLARSLDGGRAFRDHISEDLPGLVAPDESRVTLRHLQAPALPLADLAAPAAAITSAAGAGAGAFLPTTDGAAGTLELVAFAAHVDGRPLLDRVVLSTSSEPSSLAAALDTGRVDVGPLRPGRGEAQATLLLLADPAQPPFRDRAARAALAAIVDRVDLVRHFLPGAEPLPALLAPALLPPLGGEPVATVPALSATVALVVSHDVPPLVSQRVVARLGAAGLATQVTALPAAEALRAGAPLRLVLWSPEVAEPLAALDELALLAPVPETAARTLAAAALETNADRRRALLHTAEASLREDAVLVPLASVPLVAPARRTVHGLAIDQSGRLRLEDAWVEP